MVRPVKCCETGCEKQAECADFCEAHLRPRLERWFEGCGAVPAKLDLESELVRLAISAVRSIFMGHTKDARGYLGGILKLLCRACEKCDAPLAYPAKVEFTFDEKCHVHTWCPGHAP